MEIREVKIQRILNPTSINLGECVINPYKGCMYGCLYCYVRFNKVVMNEKRNWGEYVDVRINAPDQLKKEIQKNKPKDVLLGSTTECFQPIEKQYKITQSILEILNDNKIYYSILTRSPLCADYAQILSKGYCQNIYFTVNDYSPKLKELLEPCSPEFESRFCAIDKLLDSGINVMPSLSPLLPHVSSIENIFNRFARAKMIIFEGLNFNLGNIDRVIDSISLAYPDLADKYILMRNDARVYNEVWSDIKNRIIINAIKHKKNHNIHIHGYRGYFENNYRT